MTIALSLTDRQQDVVTLAAQLAACEDSGIPGLAQGFAGTGKTTCISAIKQALGDIIIVSPTGRAALRVTEATGIPACTIHSWLYRRVPNEDGESTFVLRDPDKIDRPRSRLLIVDECSMVNEDIANDLLSMAETIDINVLFMGDSFQLPPVKSTFNIFEWDRIVTERVQLTEILRQAMDSPIVRASMMLREDRGFESLNVLERVPTKSLIDRMADTFDSGGVIICRTNKLRQQLNNLLRAAYGVGDQPIQPSEPLLVCKNNYMLNRFNGEITTFEGWLAGAGQMYYDDNSNDVHRTLHFAPASVSGQQVMLCVETVMGVADDLKDYIIARASSRYARSKGYFVDSNAPEPQPLPYLHATLGYVLTGHRCQGSEWPSAFVIIEGSVRLNEEEGRRWLYTAITRAKRTVRYTMVNARTIYHQPSRQRQLPGVTGRKAAAAPLVVLMGDANGIVARRAREAMPQIEIRTALQDWVISGEHDTRSDVGWVEREARTAIGTILAPNRLNGFNAQQVLVAEMFLAARRSVYAYQFGRGFTQVKVVQDGKLYDEAGAPLVDDPERARLVEREEKLKARINDDSGATAEAEKVAAMKAIEALYVQLGESTKKEEGKP